MNAYRLTERSVLVRYDSAANRNEIYYLMLLRDVIFVRAEGIKMKVIYFS